jgi:hypothetical protein
MFLQYPSQSPAFGCASSLSRVDTNIMPSPLFITQVSYLSGSSLLSAIAPNPFSRMTPEA